MHTLKLGLAVMAFATVIGCQGPGSLASNGSLVITLPSGARSVNANGGEGDLVRLQVVRNGFIVPLSGQNYLERNLSGQTVTIDGLATGSGYNLYASTGQKNTATGGGFYETAYFSTSAGFEISAGTATSVNLSLTATPISIIEDSANSFHRAAVVSTALEFIDGSDFNSVYSSDPAKTIPTQTYSGFLAAANATGATVYDVTNPGAGLWFSTDRGVFVTAGNNLQNAAAHPMLAASGGIGGNLSPVPVVYSAGAITLLSGTSLAYYYGPGLSAGFAASQNQVSGDFNKGNPKWTTLTTFFSLNNAPSLQTALGKLEQAVFGVATDNKNFFYVSTGIGAYHLDSSVFSSSNTTASLGTAMTSGVVNGKSIVLATQDSSLIGPVSAFSDNVATAFGFAGTSRGLYGSTVAVSTGTPTTSDGTLPLIPGTAGLSIASLATATSDITAGAPTKAYTAAYSSNTQEILILHSLSVVGHVPALAGLPSGVPQLTWYAYQSAGKTHLLLIVAGNEATVEYPADVW